MDRKTRKIARRLAKTFLREMEDGKQDLARDLRSVKRKAALAGAGSTLTALGLCAMLASGIARGATRARRRSALWVSGVTSALGVLGLLSAKKLSKRGDILPAQAKARIKHADPTAAKAMS